MLLYRLIEIYQAIIIVKIILSWIRPDPNHLIIRWINMITDPVLEPVRRLLPDNRMGFDFSPLIVLVALDLIKRVFIGNFVGGY